MTDYEFKDLIEKEIRKQIKQTKKDTKNGILFPETAKETSDAELLEAMFETDRPKSME
jgi:hypothetical protein